MGPADPVACSFCIKVLSSKKNFRRHLRTCKKNPQREQDPFTCICGSQFSRRDYLVRHVQKCPSNTMRVKPDAKHSFRCEEQDCCERFRYFRELIHHLKSVHRAKMNPVQFLQFPSMTEFSTWKEEEELRTYSYFFKYTGTAKSRMYFHCQHDGSSRAHCKSTEPPRLTTRKLKRGRIKKDIQCLARMLVNLKETGVAVEYHSTHSHPLSKDDFAFQPATRSAREHIRKQLLKNIAPGDILKSLTSFQSGNDGLRLEKNKCISRRSILIQRAKIEKARLQGKFESLDDFHDYDNVVDNSPMEYCPKNDEDEELVRLRAYHGFVENLQKMKQLIELNNVPLHLLNSGNAFLEQFMHQVEVQDETSQLVFFVS